MAYGVTTYLLDSYGIGQEEVEAGGGIVALSITTPKLQLLAKRPTVAVALKTPALRIVGGETAPVVRLSLTTPTVALSLSA